MPLPTFELAVLITFRDTESGAWGCFVGDQSRQIYGYTVGMTALKATSKAIDVLTGRASPATIRPLEPEMRADILRQARGVWPVGLPLNA